MKVMVDFRELLTNCINNKNNDSFEKHFDNLFAYEKIQKWLKQEIKYLQYKYNDKSINEEYVKPYIRLCIEDYKLRKNLSGSYVFTKKIEKFINNEDDYDKRCVSLDAQMSDESSTAFIDLLESPIYTPDKQIEINEKTSIKNEIEKIKNELRRIKINKKWFDALCIICLRDGEYKNLQDLMNVLCEIPECNIAKEDINRVNKMLAHCKQRSELINEKLNLRFSPSQYAAIIEYLINTNNKKLKIPELITDFNKIRNYLSILFIQDDINNKSDFIEKSGLSDSSYEKDIRRILSLFNKSEEKIFNIKKELKEFKPNKLGKIYETHTVSNLVSNLLILDVLSQYKSEQTEQFEKIKLTTIINELFKNSDYDEKDIFNFRKYNLLPRLKELEEYGFVSRDNDKYSLHTNFFTDEQKKSLEFVVPFFCGIYPFSSIGHSLANRLDINDKFKIEQYNASNILEDCIVYDLLNAINNKEKIKIVFKGKEETFEEVTPIELFIEKKSNLLKLKDNEKEYYLHNIQGFPDEESKNPPKTKKSKKIKLKKSPIFSEIYSFYYKIFEEVVGKYKKDEIYDIAKVIKNYGSKDTCLYSDKIEELLPKLAKLKNISIPLTILELRWLKTIMQDVRFDLFVTNDEKQSLEILVEDVESFDLTSFKVYSAKEKKYKSITDFGMPEGTDKVLLRKQLKELNTILFNIEKNSFPELAKTHHK